MKRFTIAHEGYNIDEVNRFIVIVIKRLEKLNMTAIKQINLLKNDKNIDKITVMDNKNNSSLIESK